MTRRFAALAALWAALVAGACGNGGEPPPAPPAREDPGTPALRIGTKDFTEQFVLGELYAQALRARGFRVELKPDVGSTEIIHAALAGGALDMYPEYIGVLLSEVARVRERPAGEAAAYRLAKRYEERRGFTLLARTPFSDANALAVRPAVRERRRVRSIPDLRRLGDEVTIGAPPEFASRFEGLVGLRAVYGLNGVTVSRMAIGLQYEALDRGRVDAAAVFTTDGRLAGGRYALLEDPRDLFAEQHVAPVISREALRRAGPGLADAIDAVSRRLTTSAMREMNAAVDLEGRTPAEVADRFLQDAGLK